MGKLIGYSKSLLIPIVAIFVLTIGMINEPQNAYAGINGNGENGNGEVFEPTDIWCEVFGEWESGTGFWKFRGDNEFWAFSEGDAECLLIRDLEEIEIEVDVEIHGKFVVGDKIEPFGDHHSDNPQCRDVTTKLTIFIDDESFQGTLEVETKGEICRNEPDETDLTSTFQDIESGILTMGGTGDFSNIVAGEGTFTSVMERGSDTSGLDFEAIIHTSLVPAEPIENAIWCEGFGEWEPVSRFDDSEDGKNPDGKFWKDGGDNEFFAETECLLILDFKETEVFAEVSGQYLVGDKFLDLCRFVTTELTIFIDDEGFEGTLEAEATGEICRSELTFHEVDNTFQDLKITGGTGDFDFFSIVGEGTFTSKMERGGGDYETEIHTTLVIDHGKVIEVHCETVYEWFVDPESEDENFAGERGESEGICIYEFEDGVFEEIGIFVTGEFILTSLTITEGGVMNITGTFHVEDFEENAIWVEETGTITIGFCDEEPKEEFEGIPICIETTGTVIQGQGIFEGFTGTYESEGFGFITDFIGGFSFRTVWVFFEEPTPTVQSGGGKGCSGECNPPTMGLNKAGDFRLVDGGFTCNGQTTDVLHFYTPFPKIENKVGEPLRCTFKIYEDSGADKIRHFEFAVGKKFGSAMSDVQGKIVWDRTFKGEESVTYDEHLFRDVSVKAMGLTKCRTVSNSANCLLLSLSATPKEPLVDDIIVMTNIWDHRRNAKQNTHNEGIDFVGMTENPLPFYTVVDGRNGITAIYTTDFSLQDLDHAVDRHGKTWTKINNIWHKDFVMPDMSCIKGTYLGYDRYCPEFTVLKQGQAEMGKQFFDSSKIVSEITEPFAYEFPDRDRDRLAGTQLQGI